MIRFLCLVLLPLTVFALYDSGTSVEVLTDSSFSKVLKSDGVWLVEFFAPWCGHCKNLVPEWEKVAKALKGIVHVAAVDATAHQSLAGQYQVQGYPTILVFAGDKKNPQKYDGGRTADAITEAGLKAARDVVKARVSGKKSGSSSGSSGKKKSSDVIELTASNFNELVLESSEPWLVEFFAPWCGHCKNLAPEWEKAATELKGSVKLGAVDATVHSDLAAKYDVKGYPTIKFFAPGDRTPQEYNSGRTSNAIVEWALAKLESYGVGPEVIEILSEEQMQTECYSKKVCVVTILPHLIDTGAKGRLALIDTVKEAAKKLRGKGMSFVWLQGGTQSGFEQAFSLNAGYPALLALSHSKQRVTIHRNAFTVDAIARTLKNPSSTTTYKELPKLATTQAWDGKDYVADEEL